MNLPRVRSWDSVRVLGPLALNIRILDDRKLSVGKNFFSLVSSCICSRRWPSWPSLRREAPWSCKLYIPQYRGMPGPRNVSVCVCVCVWEGSGGEGLSDFWDSI